MPKPLLKNTNWADVMKIKILYTILLLSLLIYNEVSDRFNYLAAINCTIGRRKELHFCFPIFKFVISCKEVESLWQQLSSTAHSFWHSYRFCVSVAWLIHTDHRCIINFHQFKRSTDLLETLIYKINCNVRFLTVNNKIPFISSRC